MRKTVVALATIMLASMPYAAQASQTTDEVRVIKVMPQFDETTAKFWHFKRAVRDWNRASHIRFRIVKNVTPDTIIFREFVEMEGMGEVELSVWIGPDPDQGYPNDEMWLNYTEGEWSDPEHRQAITCNGLGMLLQNLPVYQHIGTSYNETMGGSCMSNALRYMYPIPDSFIHPGQIDLNLAR